MKAVVYTGPEQMELRDVPDPVVGEGEELVRITHSGICGSDMHGFLGHDARRPPPLILGHEAAGNVVGGLRDGQKVAINPLVACGVCLACRTGRENICPDRQLLSMPPREGAFAELVSVPSQNLVEVPDDVPLAKAALTEPMAVGWHAALLALDSLHHQSEMRAHVLGGGAIGVTCALSLRAMNCADVTIVEPNPIRAAYLRDTFDFAVQTEAKGSPSIVMDAVGYAATRATASAIVQPGGVIAHVGLGEDTGGLDVRRMTLHEISFLGTYTYTAQDFRDTAQAIFDGLLGPLDWVEQRHLSEGPQAFADIRAGRVAAPKIILTP